MIPEVQDVSNQTQFTDPSLAFDHYLKLRLADSMPSEKKKVMDLINNRTQVNDLPEFSSSEGLNTNAELEGAFIQGHQPMLEVTINAKELVPSWVFYAVMVHEIEHYLQSIRILKALPELPPMYSWQQISYTFATDQRRKSFIFYLEVGAMLAEHRFLKMIDPKEIPGILKKLEKLGSNAKGDPHSGFEARIIKNSYMSDVQYLKSEWKLGRYSLDSLMGSASEMDRRDRRPTLENLMSRNYCHSLFKATENF